MTDPRQGAPAGDAGGQGSSAGSGKPAPPRRPGMSILGMKSIHLFKVAGIDVSLHPAWFLALAYIVYLRKDEYRSPVWGGIECLGLFAIVLLHEFGHAFACRQTGGKADHIMLWPLGGVAYVQPPPRPGAFLWSIAAGPLVNVVLLPVTWFLYAWGSTSNWADQAPDLLRCAEHLVGINLTLLMFNMLPIYPLDGGQIVQSLLWFVIGRAYSLLVVSVIGFVAGAAAVVAALQYTHFVIPYTGLEFSSPWSFLVPFYMIQRSMIAFRQARAMTRIEKMPRAAGFACPECGQAPFAEEIWLCDECKARFNPFVTGKACLQCGKVHENVRCPFCGKMSDPDRWRR